MLSGLGLARPSVFSKTDVLRETQNRCSEPWLNVANAPSEQLYPAEQRELAALAPCCRLAHQLDIVCAASPHHALHSLHRVHILSASPFVSCRSPFLNDGVEEEKTHEGHHPWGQRVRARLQSPILALCEPCSLTVRHSVWHSSAVPSVLTLGYTCTCAAWARLR